MLSVQGITDKVRTGILRYQGRPDIKRLRRAGATIGEGVFIGRRTLIDPDFAYLVTIESRATLSIGVLVLAHDASTKHVLGKSRIAPVWIGSRSFIGAYAILLPGTVIGEGAIVGAGSVVRGTVAPGTVVAGNPARRITTVADYCAKHQDQMVERPVWSPRSGWTSDTGITPDRVAEVRSALAGGEGYID